MTIDSRITLQKLEVFTTVVEAKSVTKAADLLHVAQPVVSAHLRSLQERVGSVLFVKEGRTLALTPAGQAVYDWARGILVDSSELDRWLAGLADGTEGAVNIAASMSVGSYMLPALLSEFAASRPRVRISLNIYHSDHALRVVEAGESDFAVVLAESHVDGPTIVGKRVGNEPLVVIVSPDSDLPGQITVTQLSRQRFVELPEGFLRRVLNDAYLAKAGLEQREIAIEMGHPEAIKRAVREGLGVAVMFQSAIEEEVASGKLRVVSVRGLEVSVPVCIVHRRGRRFTRAQMDVMDAIARGIPARQ